MRRYSKPTIETAAFAAYHSPKSISGLCICPQVESADFISVVNSISSASTYYHAILAPPCSLGRPYLTAWGCLRAPLLHSTGTDDPARIKVMPTESVSAAAAFVWCVVLLAESVCVPVPLLYSLGADNATRETVLPTQSAAAAAAAVAVVLLMVLLAESVTMTMASMLATIPMESGAYEAAVAAGMLSARSVLVAAAAVMAMALMNSADQRRVEIMVAAQQQYRRVE